MKIKTSELSGMQLSFAVAAAHYPEWVEEGWLETLADLIFDSGEVFSPHASWSQGGPIIEAHITKLESLSDAVWVATDSNFTMMGGTALEAGLRCYVASELGLEVEVPADIEEAVSEPA